MSTRRADRLAGVRSGAPEAVVAARPRRSMRPRLGSWGLGLRRWAPLSGGFGQSAREGRSLGRAAAPTLGAGLGGGGERPAPTSGPGARAVPAAPETPRGPGPGATAVAGPSSDRCRRPLPAAGIALPPGEPGARKFLELRTDSLFSPFQVLKPLLCPS